ncbi:hypothetical protein LCGC14_2249990 [marine sediment metagenome]|uniref:Glycosyltransferase 2-like domain-containing protein n=1 Tax=marine sediment metagenome TaxID=412755 RepID=A0A0F9FFE2_9ZZZZ
MRLPVTIVVTYYNQKKNLERTLPLWIEQGVQVIVCDDGSKKSQSPKAICDKYGATYFWQANEDNRQSEAFQRGLELTKTSFVMFTDADAIPCKGWADAMLGAWEPKRLLTGPREYKDKKGEWIRDWRQKYLDVFEHVDLIQKWKLMIGCNIFGLTKTFIDNGGWDINYRGYGLLDWDVSYRWVKNGGLFKYVPKAIVRFDEPPAKGEQGYFTGHTNDPRAEKLFGEKFPELAGVAP